MYRSCLVLLVLCSVCSCGAPTASEATAHPVATLTTESEPIDALISTSLPSPTTAPTEVDLPTKTDEPIATEAPSPTIESTAASTSEPTVDLALTPPNPPASIQPLGTDDPLLGSSPYRTKSTDDDFVSVREQPNSTSALVQKLTTSTVVECIEFVASESLDFGGQRSHLWAYCPSVSGYAFGLLLVADVGLVAVSPTAQVADVEAAVIAASSVKPGDVQGRPLNTRIENVCVVRRFATAGITALNMVAEPGFALLQRTCGSWNVITNSKGFSLIFASVWNMVCPQNSYVFLLQPFQNVQ